MAASIWILLCFVGVCHLIHPLFNSPLLLLCEKLWCVQIMVRNPPTDRTLMERIVVAARLQFGMLPVGVDNAQIVRVFRRWLRRNFNVLNFPWCAKVRRRLSLLRLMTEFRTSGDGKCLFWYNS